MVNCRRDLDDALKHSQKAVELEPKAAGYLDTLAEIHFRKGNREKAVELMKKCIEFEPANSYFKKQLVRFKDQSFDSLPPEEDEEE
jgi:tetratricopeptide (TPR) repeat protein